MSKSKVQVITTIYFDRIEYSLQYEISEEFDIQRTRNCIYLCEYAIMHAWCTHLNINELSTKHWLPSGKLSNVTFIGCPIEVVKDAAELVGRIIDAEKIDVVTIDAREKRKNIYKVNRNTNIEELPISFKTFCSKKYLKVIPSKTVG